MVNTSSSSSSLLDNASLAQMLRECASLVERNEHSALLYKAVEALNAYAESNGHTPASAPKSTLTRPSFQRPTNQKSNLIANGWIEQIRRSKFRTIWKEVLASLVEARQPGEETTLWIQRETMSKTTNGTGKGTTTLEAIHQIPMKWLLDVKLLDFYGDFRFSIKVYNVPEDFVFRTRDEESCREWVATLISAKESSNSKRATEAAAEVNFPDLLGKESKKDNSNSNNGSGGSHHSDSSKYEFPDLDMNTGNPKPSAPPMMNHGSTTSCTATAAAASNSSRNSNGSAESRSSTARNVNHDKGQDATTSTQSKNRMSIKELRAIAHGAGYDTRGMERSDLEKIAAYFAPVSEKTGQYKQQQQQQQQQQPKQNGSNHSQQHWQQQQRQPPNREEEKRQEASRMQEEMKKQAEARMKEEEMKRKQQQQQPQPQPQPQPQQQQNQQHAWQHQSSWNTPPNSFGASSATSSPRRPNPSQNMFESTRFFSYEAKSGESGPRRKQPFPSHQPHQQFPAKSQTYGAPPEPSPAASAAPPSFNYQQRTAPPNPPPPPQSSSMPQNSNQQRTCDPTSPLNQKYAKAMAANQQPTASVQDEQAIISSIKRNILITWALVPPQYNMLRPIDQLLSSIHKVFPPFSNVASHDYFSKWQPINHPDLLLGSVMSGADEAKLKKAVRKLRVFLHPDRLPKEFDSKQSFVCKMLWDVSNDAYEDFLKSKEDLDWIGS